MDDKVLEPVKYYENQGKAEHLENINNYFDELVQKSNVNVEENHSSIANWKKKQEEVDAISKVIRKFKFLRVLLIIGIVVGGILSAVGGATISESTGIGILLILVGILFIVGAILLMVKKVNPVLKDNERIKQEYLNEMKKLENEAWAQMQPLNDLFSNRDAINLIEKTLPDFKFDNKFTNEQEKLFMKKYDFMDLQTDECSMLNTLSGSYAGNPFVFGRRRVHKMGTQVYHGSLHITWTETYTDSQGNTRTRTKSQTLHASVTKPKPFYHTNTFLLFGNQAAPNLSFSRRSNHIEDLNEKQLEKKVKKGEKQLQKIAKQSLKANGSFQEMSNSEFDVLFGATDRDNEVEFRLMYTPLGQRSTVELLKDSKNFGDDFDFIKQKRCNVVISDHAQNWKMNIYANDYKHFDFEVIKSRFISLNETYFKSIFFDFAPFFCVPAYLEEPCDALDDYEEYNKNFTYYEHEVMANVIGYKSFEHEDSYTESILKTQTLHADNGRDIVAVTAYSYMGIERVDFIPVRGGDGNYHNVPVPWIEYIPISKTSHVAITNEDNSDENTSVYYHGMGAGIINED